MIVYCTSLVYYKVAGRRRRTRARSVNDAIGDSHALSTSGVSKLLTLCTTDHLAYLHQCCCLCWVQKTRAGEEGWITPEREKPWSFANEGIRLASFKLHTSLTVRRIGYKCIGVCVCDLGFLKISDDVCFGEYEGGANLLF